MPTRCSKSRRHLSQKPMQGRSGHDGPPRCTKAEPRGANSRALAAGPACCLGCPSVSARPPRAKGQGEAEPPERLNCGVQRAHLQLAGGSWPGAEEGGTSKGRKLGQGWEHRKEERWGGIGAKGEQEAPGALPAGMGSPPAWVTKHADQMLLPAPHRAPQECQPRAAGNRTPPCTEFLRQGGVSIKMPSPPSTSTMGSTTVCILTVLLVGSFPWKCFSRSTGCGGCRAGWLLGLLLVAGWWSCPGISAPQLQRMGEQLEKPLVEALR